jgi:hypothetical protein
VRPVPLRATLVALGDAVAWRSAMGSCDAGGGSVSVTTDGGNTWTARVVPAQAVLRVLPRSATTAVLVSAGADCRPEVRRSTDGGLTWGVPADAATTWWRDPTDSQLVHAPGPGTARPCGDGMVLDLAPLTSWGALVLCSDGDIRTTRDSGATWTTDGSAPGALALDSRVEAEGWRAYVVRVTDGCRGLQVARVNAAPAAPEVLGCVVLEAGPADAGSVTLSIYGPNGWVGIGERTWRSRDGLRTWVSG